MVSSNGAVTAINITIEFPGLEREAELDSVVRYAREMVRQYKVKYPEIDFHITGVAFLNKAFVEAGERDSTTLVPLSFLAMLVLLYALLNSISAVVGVMMVIIFSVITTMGIGGYLGISLTPASMSSVQMTMVLVVASSVHMLVSFLSACSRTVQTTRLTESLRVNVQPIILTSLTTMVGFLGMNFSEVPPFNDLGNLVAMGGFCVDVLFANFFACIDELFTRRHRKERQNSVSYLSAIATFVIKRQNFILITMGGVVLSSAYFASFNQPEESFLEVF
jgi:Predicted exporters of the RND superfamily